VTVAYADTADEGDDHFSMPIAKVVNGKAYIVDVVFNQSNLTINHDLVLAKIKEHGIDHLYIESNNAGASFIRNLRESSSCSISAVKNTANKQQRIFAESGWVENNFYFKKSPEDEYYKFFKQLTRYTKNGGSNQKDDSPDSVAGLSWCFRRYFIDLFE
jgi:predicted phage terminase large subunit-like protein